MQVRVENIYYLLCYAWDCLAELDQVRVDALEAPSPEALFARILTAGVDRLLRRQLDRGYVAQAEDTRRPRGRVDMGSSVARGLVSRGALQCEFDDLNGDVLHNRILKATLHCLASVSTLDGGLRTQLREAERGFVGVGSGNVSLHDFRRVQLHSNLRRYRFLLHVCELVHRSVLPHPTAGRWEFKSFTGSPQQMGEMFEAFTRGFFAAEQTAFRVSRPHVAWDADGEGIHLLPTMKTDVVLKRVEHTVIVEAKCYGDALVSQHGGRGKVRSKDLYQLLAYLTNWSAKTRDAVDGVLLYAVDDDDLGAASLRIRGHRVLVRPVNLNKPWAAIRDDLLATVAAVAGGSVERVGAITSNAMIS